MAVGVEFEGLGVGVLGAFRSAIHMSFPSVHRALYEGDAGAFRFHHRVACVFADVGGDCFYASDGVVVGPGGSEAGDFYGHGSDGSDGVCVFLWVDRGIGFTILMASLGLFFFSVMPIVTAATMDQVGARFGGVGDGADFRRGIGCGLVIADCGG